MHALAQPTFVIGVASMIYNWHMELMPGVGLCRQDPVMHGCTDEGPSSMHACCFTQHAGQRALQTTGADLVGREQACHEAQRGGLARAGAAYDADRFPSADFDVHAAQDVLVAE